MRSIGELTVGERAVVRSVGCKGALRRRLLDLGLTPGTVVAVKRVAPAGDPMALSVRGCVLSIRRSDARLIKVKKERT